MDIVEDKKRFRDRARHIKGVTFGNLGFCTSSAICRKGTGPEWIEVVHIDMPVGNLPEKLRGKRIVHLSDIHCSNTVSRKYLERCIKRVNVLSPDIVVLTGDYVTHDLHGKFRQDAVELVGKIQSRYGVYACLGNHDYGIGSLVGRQAEKLVNGMICDMSKKGVTLLRNESVRADIEGQGLWLVGLGDLWAGDLDPDKAFAKVPCKEATIALIHNPDGIDHLHSFPADIVMAGHTHGTTVNLTLSPKKALRSRRYHAGLFEVGDKKLYVNRGLGRLGRTLFNARPEITVMTLV